MLNKLLKKLATDELSAKVAFYQTIRDAIGWFEQKKREAREDCEKFLRELNGGIVAEQQKCDHPILTHHPDASGGNDSSTECDVCGKKVGF